MNNLSQRQIIAIGVVCLFGIPICLGLVVGHFAGFWVGALVTVVTIGVIAHIAQRWWQKQVRQKEGKDTKEDKDTDAKC